MRLSPKLKILMSLAVGVEASANPFVARRLIEIRREFMVIEAKNLSKDFFIASNRITVLKGVTFALPESSWATLMGPSGSGKSTLLSLLAGLDIPSQGSLKVLGESLEKLSEEQRTQFRAHNMSFVFQSFRLISTLTAKENVQIPLELLNSKQSEQKAKAILDRVGLAHRMDHFPSQLSGGEQQRVALARAFISKPKILFADEPTGNLDSINGSLVLKLLKELVEESKSTLFVVTHDVEIAKMGSHQFKIKDGELSVVHS